MVLASGDLIDRFPLTSAPLVDESEGGRPPPRACSASVSSIVTLESPATTRYLPSLGKRRVRKGDVQFRGKRVKPRKTGAA